MTVHHEHWMRMALDLAARGAGTVSPNPLVGCVIVHNETPIAQGWHQKFGGPHAEVNALTTLDVVPPDAIMYVTLEPCSHVGKTPPCADAIIAAGIRHVVVGMTDPNPKVSGRGIERLRSAGIHVTTDVLPQECAWMNRAFITWVTAGKPWVMAKVAQSLDGCIATHDGTSKWITSAGSRAVVHQLRATVDAVITGIGTVLHDDPMLTVRHVEGRNPARIVLDSRLRLLPSSALVASVDQAPLHVLCAPDMADSAAADALRSLGTAVHGIPAGSGRLDVGSVLDVCATQLGFASVLIEAGPTVLTSFLQAHAINELHLHVAPIMLGLGRQWNALRPATPAEAQRWHLHHVDYVDGDLHQMYVSPTR